MVECGISLCIATVIACLWIGGKVGKHNADYWRAYKREQLELMFWRMEQNRKGQS